MLISLAIALCGVHAGFMKLELSQAGSSIATFRRKAFTDPSSLNSFRMKLRVFQTLNIVVPST